MNLYHLSQTDIYGYDTYDSCVVAAESEEAARLMHPAGGDLRTMGKPTWARYPNEVKVDFIGVAADHIKAGVVCASFNQG